MRGTLYKNLFQYRLELIIFGIFQLISSVALITFAAGCKDYEVDNVPFLSVIICWCMFFMSTIFEHQLFMCDENRTISSFIISTPNGAKGHVAGKYYTILLVNIAILVWYFWTDVIVCVVLGTTVYSMGAVLVILFSFNLIYSAYSNPFYLRFGVTFGNNMKFGVLGVAIFLIGLYLLFGDISFLLGDDPVKKITEFLTGGMPMLILSLVPPFSVVLYYLSYRLSVAMYRKGVESYE